jgi:phosphohistidine phosphatase
MKTLYLLRHATAAAATPPQMSDFDRTLSGKGVLEARAVGRYMKANRMLPDFIHCSAALRTAQTARIVMEALFGAAAEAHAHFDQEFYQAPDEKLLAAIRAADAAKRSLLVVAHNPGVAEMAYALGKVSRYEPATLSIFRADCGSWAEFSPATAKLQKI